MAAPSHEMTVPGAGRSPGTRATDVAIRVNAWNRPMMVLAGAMAVLVVVTAAGILADGRVLAGDPIWMKPFKFSVSILLHALTLTWMPALLPRRSRPAEWSALVIVLSLFIETAIVVVQVIRGTTSHYNMATPFDAALWNITVGSIIALFFAHLLIAVAVLRARIPDRVVRTGIALGVGVSLLGLFVTTPMGSAKQHTVGTAGGGPGPPVVGYAGITVLTPWQAMRQQPLIRPDALTLTAFGALAGLVVAGTALTLRADPHADAHPRA